MNNHHSGDTTSYIGQPITRVEDARFVRGQGQYVDDLHAPGAFEVAFLRSDQAHAKIRHLDTSLAEHMPGVVAIFDGRDVAEDLEEMVFAIAKLIPDSVKSSGDVWSRIHPMPAMPTDRLTYVGQPYAMVVAETRYQAEDALELIEVDLEPLAPVVTAQEALADDAPLLEPEWGSNLALSIDVEKGEVDEAFSKAAVVIEETFYAHRYIASPIETRGVLARADSSDGTLQVWASVQTPHQLRDFLASALKLDKADLRVKAPDVGGGFGPKGMTHPEELLVPWAARRLSAAVKWIEDRNEHFTSTAHGRDQVHTISLAADEAGRVLAVKDDILHNCGAFHTLGLVVPYNTVAHLLGPYDVPAARISVRAAITNTGIVAPYRGAGRPEAVFAMERAMDRLAREVGKTPVEIRKHNMVTPDQMPYATGLVYRDGFDQIYDSGDYPALLNKAAELLDEAELRKQEDDRYRIGVGYAAYVEGTGVGPFETVTLTLNANGRVQLSTGATSSGQAHATTLAQIVGDYAGVSIEDIDFVGGDTHAVSDGFGTIASRSLVVAGNAAANAAEQLRNEIHELASVLLGSPEGNLELRQGKVFIDGEETGKTLSDIAGLLSPFHPKRPQNIGTSIEVRSVDVPGPVTYSAAVQAAGVRVDTVTGHVSVLRFVVSHDSGRAVNPQVVEGQILGGSMQGIAGGLYEEIAYDQQGQLTTGSFLDYLVPTAAEVPKDIRLAHVDCPTDLNPLGVKGVGESGAIGAPAAVVNAVENALGEVKINRGPLTPSRVFAALKQLS